MSASSSPTRVPSRRSASARLVAIVLFPTQDHVPHVRDRVLARRFACGDTHLEVELHELHAKRLQRRLHAGLHHPSHLFGGGADANLHLYAAFFELGAEQRPESSQRLLEDWVFDLA
jgi:hypothetical protein